MESDAAHQTVHQKSGAGEIAGVFQNGDKQEQQQYLRQKDYGVADPGDGPVHQQVFQFAVRQQLRHGCAQPIHTRAD